MSRRRSLVALVAAASAAVLALGACGAPGSSGSGSGNGSGSSAGSSTPSGSASSSAGSAGSASTAGSASSAGSSASGSAGSASSGTEGSASSGDGSSGSAPAGGKPLDVGIVTSLSGPLQSYGDEYVSALKAGIAYATDGSNALDGRPITLDIVDDAADPAKATAAATDMIGKGYQVLAGSVSSGVALQMAPLAAENKVLFISGPAATDGITGVNKYTFRSGRQTYQDIMTAASYLGALKGKKVTVFAQDNAFGQGNFAAVKAVFGAQGATVDSLLVPETATDLTPYGKKAADAKADLLFVAWAGTNATQMWTALDQQGAFDSSTVVTGLDIKATWPAFKPVASKVSFLAHYFDGAADNKVEQAMVTALKAEGKTQDLFSPDGFNAGLMIVHALQASTDNVDDMISALEGWSFEGPKGQMTIRASDHALLQPMYQAKLVDDGGALKAELVKALAPEDTAPPETPFK